jgi:colanic acid/amylovoran biosynthesis glycosyltransferase
MISPGSLGGRAFHHVPQLGWGQRRTYRGIADTRQPAIVHAHYLTTAYLASSIERPLIAGAYGFDVSVMARRPLWRRAFRMLAARGTTVLVEGPHMRRAVIDLGFPQEQVRVVRIAVGHEELAFSPPRVIDDLGPRFVAAGRFVEKKGLGLAISSFAATRAAWPQATLEIIGSGPLDAELRQLAEGSGAASGITFAGALPRLDYLAHIRGADVLLAPSVTARNGDSEGGAPTTILDAQALGTIVVGSTHADIPFLVEDGRTGFLAPEGSVDGLVHAIQRAVQARDLWPEIANAARAAVVSDHGDAALAASLAAAYDAALAA